MPSAVADVDTIALLVGLCLIYARGLTRAWERAGRGRLVSTPQVLWFGVGVVALAVALLPPLDTDAASSLTDHMIQHVLLMVVVAPALVMGAPLPTLLWALPDRWRRRAIGRWRAVLRTRSGPAWAVWAGATLVVQAGVMWAWHAPLLYRAALHHAPLHLLEHATFVVSAGLFWWAIGLGRGQRRGAAVPIVFVAALPGTALGAAMTLTTRIWYPEYPDLADQQMAGVVMWAFGGLVYVLAAAALFGAWLAAADRATPARSVTAGVAS